MSDDKTEVWLVERYGDPIYPMALDGYTWEEREDGSVPVEVLVFSLPKNKGACMVWGRWREGSKNDPIWGAGWSLRPVVAALVDQFLKIEKDNVVQLIEEALAPPRPKDWQPGTRDVFSDAFVELRWCWNEIERLRKVLETGAPSCP